MFDAFSLARTAHQLPWKPPRITNSQVQCHIPQHLSKLASVAVAKKRSVATHMCAKELHEVGANAIATKISVPLAQCAVVAKT